MTARSLHTRTRGAVTLYVTKHLAGRVASGHLRQLTLNKVEVWGKSNRWPEVGDEFVVTDIYAASLPVVVRVRVTAVAFVNNKVVIEFQRADSLAPKAED